MPAPTHHVFGPVPSRRLGRSLGIDLVPHKTCSYDCVYCQLGATTSKTIERGAYVLLDAVLREVEAKLTAAAAPDYITLSGSGEPTLQVELDTLIQGIKRIADRPVCVLTNGSLLWREDVRTELLGADLVIPSLDAGDAAMFQRVNRPHPQLRFEQVVEGLIRFRQHFGGQIWLELFILSGLTTPPDEIAKIKARIGGLAWDRIQLNTVARPPSESWARPATAGELARAAEMLGEGAEVIAERPVSPAKPVAMPEADEILALLRRRPCTLDDLSSGLGVHRLELAKRVDELLRAQAIVMRQHGRRIYYQPASGNTAHQRSWKVRDEETA